MRFRRQRKTHWCKNCMKRVMTYHYWSDDKSIRKCIICKGTETFLMTDDQIKSFEEETKALEKKDQVDAEYMDYKLRVSNVVRELRDMN